MPKRGNKTKINKLLKQLSKALRDIPGRVEQLTSSIDDIWVYSLDKDSDLYSDDFRSIEESAFDGRVAAGDIVDDLDAAEVLADKIASILEAEEEEEG